jgi:guanylate kinase
MCYSSRRLASRVTSRGTREVESIAKKIETGKELIPVLVEKTKAQKLLVNARLKRHHEKTELAGKQAEAKRPKLSK